MKEVCDMRNKGSMIGGIREACDWGNDVLGLPAQYTLL